MTTHTVHDDAPAADGASATEYCAPVRILNAADGSGFNYRLPCVGSIDGPAGVTLIGIRDESVAFGLPPHIAIAWALALARYTLTKTASADRALRDQLIEQAYVLIEELGAIPTHESAAQVMQ